MFKRLKKDLIKCDLANHNTKIKLGLAAGKVHQGQSEPIRVFMAKKDFWFWSPDDIKSKVKHLAERGYENDPVIITAKILMRDRDWRYLPTPNSVYINTSTISEVVVTTSHCVG